MAVSEDLLERVDKFLQNEAKVLEGYQPHWKHVPGYGDYQLAWPIHEEDSGRTRASLRFRVSDQDLRYPSISLIFSGSPIMRLDKVATDVCKPNPPWAARIGLPPEVCGTHAHMWHDNRGHVASSGQWQQPARRPVKEELLDLDAMFFWFCERINVRIQSHNRPIRLPDVGLFGRNQ